MFSSLIIYAVKSAFVLCLLYMPYVIMLRKENFFGFNRRVLVTMMLLSLILPFCNFSPLSVDEHPVMHDVQLQMIDFGIPIEQGVVRDVAIDDIHDDVVADAEYTEDGGITITWFMLVGFVYIVGMIAVLVIRVWQFVKMCIVLRSGCLWTDEKDGYRIYCHSNDIAPCSWFNNIAISEDDYRHGGQGIIMHEIGHIRHHHSLDLILLTFLQMIQWWNPVVYALGLSCRDVHEYEADQYALSCGVRTSEYQMLLLRKVVGGTSYAFANNFNHSLIKKRIKMMIKSKSNPWMRGKALYFIPVSFVALCAFATPEFVEPIENVVTEFTTDETPILENSARPFPNIKFDTDAKASEVQDIERKTKEYTDTVMWLIDGKVVTREQLDEAKKTRKLDSFTMHCSDGISPSYAMEIWVDTMVLGDRFCYSKEEQDAIMAQYRKKYKAKNLKCVVEYNTAIDFGDRTVFELLANSDTTAAQPHIDKYIDSKVSNEMKAKYLVECIKATNKTYRNRTYIERLCSQALSINPNEAEVYLELSDLIYQTAPRAGGKGTTRDQLFWNLGLHCCLATDKLDMAIKVNPRYAYSSRLRMFRQKYALNFFPRLETQRESAEYYGMMEGQEFEVRGERTKLRLK